MSSCSFFMTSVVLFCGIVHNINPPPPPPLFFECPCTVCLKILFLSMSLCSHLMTLLLATTVTLLTKLILVREHHPTAAGFKITSRDAVTCDCDKDVVLSQFMRHCTGFSLELLHIFQNFTLHKRELALFLPSKHAAILLRSTKLILLFSPGTFP